MPQIPSVLTIPTRLIRYLLIVVIVATALTILLLTTDVSNTWKKLPRIPHSAPSILLQELQSLEEGKIKAVQEEAASAPQEQSLELQTGGSHKFQPGIPVAGKNYSKIVVVPKTKKENIAWLDKEVPGLQKAVYVVDDSRAPLHPPKNKGNEVMVYLSYIIDHYDELPDISIFIHAHRWAWHNNDLLDSDTALMLQHLSDARIIREGYVSLRCQWYPGCPGWLRPNAEHEDEEKKEEMYVAQAWTELFPSQPLPELIGQPCCSQFAVTRERLQTLRRAEYVRLRDWLLNTKLRDSMTGRVFEYTWQILWTGKPIHCPNMHICYCDLYGACFDDENDFQSWFKTRFYIRQDEWTLDGWVKNEETYEKFVSRGRMRDAARVERAPEGKIKELKLSIDQRWIELAVKKELALQRGQDPSERARIAGREWNQGDGF